MDLTIEQRDLRDAVRGLIEKTEAGQSPWRRLCEVGVASLGIPQRYGGAGAGLAEICVVMAELGRNLTASPVLGSSALTAQAVLASGDDAACARLLPSIADGSAIAALAWTTAAGHWDSAEVAYTARETRGGWELTGEAHYVLDGEVADVLLAAAAARDGIGLFEVDASGFGVTRTSVATMDASRRLAVVRLADAPGRRIGADGTVSLAIARDRACVALSAEEVGAAQRALELTVGHLLTRVQFGQPLGSFQALQHRVADLFVLVESARALCAAVASAAYGADATADLGMQSAAAKVYCSEALSQTASEMIQLHGAMGITWDHPAHRYLKRALGDRYLFGSPSRQLATIANRLIEDAGVPVSGSE